jgi:uncharacterized membrane protein
MNNVPKHPDQPSAPAYGRIESALNRTLTLAVLVSAAIAGAGAVLYLRASGHDAPDFAKFHTQPERLMSPRAIVVDAVHLQPEAVIQLGVLVLILTPVARVVFSLALFVLRKDGMYVLITLAVLIVLIMGLLGLG